MLSRGIIFSAVLSGLFLGIFYFNLFPIPEIIEKKLSSSAIRKERCQTKPLKKITSDPGVNKIFLLKRVIEIENVENLLETLDPIFRERLLSSLDPYVKDMDVCGAREFLKSTFGIEPATPFILKAMEHIEPEIISKWLKKAEGFIFENKLLFSPEKLLETFPDELTGSFEISENRIIIYIRKR